MDDKKDAFDSLFSISFVKFFVVNHETISHEGNDEWVERNDIPTKVDEKPANITNPWTCKLIERMKKVSSCSEQQPNRPKHHLKIGKKFAHIIDNTGFSFYERKLLKIQKLSQDNQQDPDQEEE